MSEQCAVCAHVLPDGFHRALEAFFAESAEWQRQEKESRLQAEREAMDAWWEANPPKPWTFLRDEVVGLYTFRIYAENEAEQMTRVREGK